MDGKKLPEAAKRKAASKKGVQRKRKNEEKETEHAKLRAFTAKNTDKDVLVPVDTEKGSESIRHKYDTYVSYERSNKTASLALKLCLENRGIYPFMKSDVRPGNFEKNVMSAIDALPTFILIVTFDSFNEFKNDPECNNLVHREIREALRLQKRIIPVISESIKWPQFAHSLPADIASIRSFAAIKWIHGLEENLVDELRKAIFNRI